MEVGQCQCFKTYSWKIHAPQGNHGFQTANSKKDFSAKMKPTEKEKRKVSKHILEESILEGLHELPLEV